MIVSLSPRLEGNAAERFLALARTLYQASQRNRDNDLRMLLDEELKWCRSSSDNSQKAAYEASVRVLLDLVRLGWQVREEGYGIELVAERPRVSRLTPEEIRKEKGKTQALFRPAVEAQLRDPAVRNFVARMESPSVKSGKKPVTMLIADGPELHDRLLNAARTHAGESDVFTGAVSPYLQLATSTGTDQFTGHSLREIWRYFRYTWSIPQFSTPGRQLLYLVRDAARPYHAVMGIIGLNNCALQMGEEREYYLGWNLRALKERLLASAAQGVRSLADEFLWLEQQITSALNDVDPTALVPVAEVQDPTEETISRLHRRAKEFDFLRDETLRELMVVRSGNDSPVLVAETEDFDYGHPPVCEEMLGLEAKPASKPVMQKARRHLVARKRAALLADLLHARFTLLSLEIADDYCRFYTGPSIISYQLKNAPIHRDYPLVYLGAIDEGPSPNLGKLVMGTTSLALCESSMADNDPFKAAVGASLLANHAGLPATIRFASKLAPTQEPTTGYTHY